MSAALSGFGTVERKDVRLPIASQVGIPFVLQIAYQNNQSATPGFTSKGIPMGLGQPRQAFDAFQGQLGVKFTF